MQKRAQVTGNGGTETDLKETEMTFTPALHLPRPIRLVEGLSHKLAALRAAHAQHRAYLALLEDFNRMTDAEWLDLGLSRHNAREVARQTVYGC